MTRQSLPREKRIVEMIVELESWVDVAMLLAGTSQVRRYGCCELCAEKNTPTMIMNF